MAVTPTLGDIVRRYGASYIRRRGLTPRQDAVFRHIASCRTEAMGGHKYGCDSCEHTDIVHNSCRDRHCPLCQRRQSAEWVEAMQERVLPTHYFHIGFTLPHELNLIVLLNKERCYSMLFEASAGTLKELLGDAKHLGAQPAFTSVLHTWTQVLTFHAHIHSIVSGGGLSPDRKAWVASPANFLIHHKVLSMVFRRRYLQLLSDAFNDRKDPLVLKGDAAHLADRDEFARFKGRLQMKDWVAHVKEAFDGPMQVCKYFAGYTHRVGISNKRIISARDRQVTFLARKKAKDGTYIGMREVTLSVDQFLGRFKLHVLPKGFNRIRHYGLSAPSNVNTKLVHARALIEQDDVFVQPAEIDSVSANRPEHDPSVCPRCGGRMLVVRTFEPQRKDYFDTS